MLATIMQKVAETKKTDIIDSTSKSNKSGLTALAVLAWLGKPNFFPNLSECTKTTSHHKSLFGLQQILLTAKRACYTRHYVFAKYGKYCFHLKVPYTYISKKKVIKISSICEKKLLYRTIHLSLISIFC
jgi:hypothetical protein